MVDYPNKVACTVFLGGCNFKCPYCQNRDLIIDVNKLDTIPEEEVIDFLKGKKKWLDGVCITGGEPSLYSAVVDFIRKIKEIGLLVKFDSNGTNPDMLRKLIDEKLVDYLAMDIKAPIEKYDNAANSNVDKENDRVLPYKEFRINTKVESNERFSDKWKVSNGYNSFDGHISGRLEKI